MVDTVDITELFLTSFPAEPLAGLRDGELLRLLKSPNKTRLLKLQLINMSIFIRIKQSTVLR